MIGAGAVIRDAYIGPYTAIAEDVTIEHAELEHSIVLSGSTIRDLDARIEASPDRQERRRRPRRPPCRRRTGS